MKTSKHTILTSPDCKDKRLFCKETTVIIEKNTETEDNLDCKRYVSDVAEPYETFAYTTGELYHACIREHGRCTGKMYIDSATQNQIQVGWIFLKQNPEDKDTLIETWVEVFTTPPTKKVVIEGGEHPNFK
jgi:hypothetical protein